MKEERKTKYNLIKMALLIVVTVFMFSTPVQAAKLNKTSLTLVKGKTYTLKLKGTKKKATWKTKNKKIAKLSNKKKSSVKIKAVKAGKTTVTAKVGKKTYKCKVAVVNKKKTSASETKTNPDNKDSQSSDKKDEQLADKPSADKTEQTQEKKKVWIVTKWGETVSSPVYVNKRSEYECSCGYKTENPNELNNHQIDNFENEECGSYRINTIWDSVYYVTVEYPEEGYWIEVNANECPQGLIWRSDEEAKGRKIKDIKTGTVTQPVSGYYYIDKSGN